MISFILSSCSIGGTDIYFSSGNGSNNAFTMDKLKCPKKEARLYILCLTDYYSDLGGISINIDKNKEAKELLNQSALAILTRVYSLCKYANDNDITLSKEETKQAELAAAQFYNTLSQKDKSAIDMSKSEIKDVYSRYALSMKVYKSLMEGVDSDVTEDEARIMQAYVLHTQDENKLNELDNRVKRGDDFAALVQIYSVDTKGVITFGRDKFPPEVDAVAFTMEDDQVSDLIEADNGYYYIKCVKKYDELESEVNKEIIIKKRQKVLLNQIIAEQSEGSFSEINAEFFKEVSKESHQISKGEDFFNIIESYMNF